VKKKEEILSRYKDDYRSTAAFLILATTGMRIVRLLELRYGDIKEIDEFGLYLLWVYNRYRKERYFTLCTLERAAAIDAYLDYRRGFREEINDKSPLIRERFNIDNHFPCQSSKGYI
jgi:integrase